MRSLNVGDLTCVHLWNHWAPPWNRFCGQPFGTSWSLSPFLRNFNSSRDIFNVMMMMNWLDNHFLIWNLLRLHRGPPFIVENSFIRDFFVLLALEYLCRNLSALSSSWKFLLLFVNEVFLNHLRWPGMPGWNLLVSYNLLFWPWLFNILHSLCLEPYRLNFLKVLYLLLPLSHRRHPSGLPSLHRLLDFKVNYRLLRRRAVNAVIEFISRLRFSDDLCPLGLAVCSCWICLLFVMTSGLNNGWLLRPFLNYRPYALRLWLSLADRNTGCRASVFLYWFIWKPGLNGNIIEVMIYGLSFFSRWFALWASTSSHWNLFV